MKKYESNKARKLLLASMLIPIAISTLPIEDVFASEVPRLTIYDLNGSPKLEWATEMLQENVLVETSYEQGQLIPDLNSIVNNELHNISPLAAYSGGYGYLLNDNSNGKGNHFLYPNTKSDSHISWYGNLKFPNGTPLSITFKAKADTPSYMEPSGDGGWGNKVHLLPNKYVRNVGDNDTVLYLDSVEGMIPGNYITADSDPNNIGLQRMILGVDYNNKTITINGGLGKHINAGQSVSTRVWHMAFGFNRRIITNTEWQTYNINTFVSDLPDYDVSVRGGSFYIMASTNSRLYLDDLKFGYATEVEVFREGKSIYKGYLSDFHDREIRDTLAPNKIGTVTTKFIDNQLQFNCVKPSDNGITTSYKIQSIAKNGNKSALSQPQDITIKSDVVKYRYSISKNKEDTPTTTVSVNEFSLPINQLNLINDYLHIQAIDSNGNVSDVSHFKVSDLVTDDTLQDIYNKLDELEYSKDYDDFQDFINDVEDMFGGHLPQDIIDRIEDLGKYHGLNTSFLLLEQGEFTLQTNGINDFGQVKLTSKMQTVTTGFAGDFGVIDARGTQEGWKVNVTATPFTEDTFDGFVGIPNKLPLGSLSLKAPNNIERVGEVYKQDGLPTSKINDYTVIDNGAVTLLSAKKGEGLGQFKFNFDDNALVLTVDAKTAKIDNKNYFGGVTPYTSTVTWDLITGP